VHSLGIVHCDIKRDNIVANLPITPSNSVCLIDFNSATTSETCHGFIGTPGCTAPEVRDGQVWDPKAADRWAMGHFSKSLGHEDDTVRACLSEDPSRRPSAASIRDELCGKNNIVAKRRKIDYSDGMEHVGPPNLPQLTSCAVILSKQELVIQLSFRISQLPKELSDPLFRSFDSITNGKRGWWCGTSRSRLASGAMISLDSSY